MIGDEIKIEVLRSVEHLYWCRRKQIDEFTHIDQFFLPWAEVVAYSLTAPQTVTETGEGVPLRVAPMVRRVWYVGCDLPDPDGLTPTTNIDAVTTRAMFGEGQHPNELAPYYGNKLPHKQLTAEQRKREHGRHRQFRELWAARAAILSNRYAVDENELVYQSEVDVVWTDDNAKQLPFVCEILCGVANAAPVLPHKRVVGYTITTEGRARVFYLPQGCDLKTIPRGHRAVLPSSIIAGRPSKPYRGRWLPVSRRLREEFRC